MTTWVGKWVRESVHASQMYLHFRCFVGKRHLEEAMKAFSDSLSFEVTWKPFFLNPSTPETGVSLEQYLSKRYGASVAAMAKQGTGHLSKAAANVVKLIYLYSFLVTSVWSLSVTNNFARLQTVTVSDKKILIHLLKMYWLVLFKSETQRTINSIRMVMMNRYSEL